MVDIKEYCSCYVYPDSGKIIGCHLTKDGDCCGGYLTDTMLKRIKDEKKRRR